ncbi:hypothetical protein MMC17_000094 [Xylographa soralifera]|nr:hypothetical protein [Xylographa soralifera]
MAFLREHTSKAVVFSPNKILALKKEKATVVDKERRTAAIRKYVVFDPDKPSWCWHKLPWFSFRFLELPHDLRRQVYIELAWCDPKSVWKDRPRDLDSCSIDVFARVNHQVREEIQSIIYMQGFRLMELPYDIREQIYLQLWAEDPEPVATKNVKHAAQHVPRSTDHLIGVNRQIREEVLSLYSRRRLCTILMSGTKSHCECSGGCPLHHCTLLAEYSYRRPNTPLVRRCELTIDLPLELDEFRIVSNLLTSDNAEVREPLHPDYHDLVMCDTGWECPVQQIKIKLASGGTHRHFRPGWWTDDWHWRYLRREPWISSGESESGDANVFDSEQALVSKLVQLLQHDSAKKGRMTIEFWNHDRWNSKTLTMANDEQRDRILDGDTEHFWGALEPESLLTSESVQ